MKSSLFFLMLLALLTCKEVKTDSDLKPQQEVTTLPYFNTPDFTPEWGQATHKIPDFSFVNQNGDAVNNKTFEGKIYVANFFFTTCPGICPKLTSQMSFLQAEYLKDNSIMLLSHTVMPWVDDVDKLKKYAKDNAVNSEKWHLVTGERTAIYNIARTGYFADEEFKETQDESEFIHTEHFILVDKQGYIRGVYNGAIALDVKRLMRHLEILKKEG